MIYFMASTKFNYIDNAICAYVFQVKKHSSCQTIPSLGDRDAIDLLTQSDLLLRSTSFRRATSECPLVVTEESITPFNIWNFNETPV